VTWGPKHGSYGIRAKNKMVSEKGGVGGPWKIRAPSLNGKGARKKFQRKSGKRRWAQKKFVGALAAGVRLSPPKKSKGAGGMHLALNYRVGSKCETGKTEDKTVYRERGGAWGCGTLGGGQRG